LAETKKKVIAKKAKPKPKVKSKAKPSAKPKGNAKNTTDMNGYLPNLITLFKDNISPALQKQLGLKNPYQVPRIQKISLNIGIGNAREEKNALEHAINDLTTITGQKAVVTKAKKAISNFKLRVGIRLGQE
jgi:hypothetical protein